ncbi:MAG: hypothetical protein EA400_01235 [Chromatiaceae bacterium]|nr:MAG: hypothetical protein EA400_01235 [Chromatiaceae bacterium]
MQALARAEALVAEVEVTLQQLGGKYEPGHSFLPALDQAEQETRQARQLDPKAEQSGYSVDCWLGRILAHKGLVLLFEFHQRGAALERVLQAAARCGEMPMIQYAMALVYEALGRRKEALEHARQAVDLADRTEQSSEYRRVLERLEAASGLVMQLRAFRGSWRVLAGLGVALLLMLFFAIEIEHPALWVLVLVLSGISFGYWKLKSR